MGDSQLGVCVSGLFRDFLVDHGMEYKKALDISLEVDRAILDNDWLRTYNGTTFEKTFIPGKSKINQE